MSMCTACSTSSRRAAIAPSKRSSSRLQSRPLAIRRRTRWTRRRRSGGIPRRRHWRYTPRARLLAENLLRLYKQRYGLDYIALRYSTVYGERQHHRGVNALHIIESYERIKAGERPVIAGDGSEAHDYVYVGDVARANVMAMTSEVSGESFLIA